MKLSFPIDADLKALWTGGLEQESRRSALAFFLLILISTLVNLLFPSLQAQALERVYSMLAESDVVTPEGTLSFLSLFTNNLMACISTMLYGLLPFVQLSALALGLNACLLGVMAAFSIQQGAPFIFLAGIVPHGIFEFPALILAFAMGLYVCGQMTRRCKKDKSAHSLFECMTLISKLLFLVLVPLLLLAAATEAWITPQILLLFQ